MKNNIVADGEFRLWRGQKALKADPVEKQHAAALAQADPAEKKEISRRMTVENLRREKMLNHRPSAASLW